MEDRLASLSDEELMLDPFEKRAKPDTEGLDCSWCAGTEGECLGGDEGWCTGEKDCPGGCQGTERDPDEWNMKKGGPGMMQDCAFCQDRVHESHGNWLDENSMDEFVCDQHWDYNKGNKPQLTPEAQKYVTRDYDACFKCRGKGVYRKKSCPECRGTGIGAEDRLAKIAQDGGGGGGDGGGGMGGGDSGGGDSGGGDSGGGDGGMAAGGDAAPSGGGDDAPQSPSGSFGPDQDSDEAPKTCGRCGDRAYSNANGTYWNCARCGWAYPLGPRPPRKKKREEEDLDPYSTYAKVAADPLGINTEWKGDIRGPAAVQDPEAAEEWGACQYDDGHTAVTDFLGKKVCHDHLRYALEDAPKALDKATEGVKTTTGVDRLNFQNAVQKIKKDISRGEKTLREVELKKDLKDRGVAVASTQEKKVMEYNCDKCGVQATHESVTRTGGRGLLCAEHADSFKLANDAAGIVAKVFPLHVEAAAVDDPWKGAGCASGKHDECTLKHGDRFNFCQCRSGKHKEEWETYGKPSGGRTSSEAEKVAAVSCVDCDGDGTCDQCGGPGCNACDASGNCISCKGDGYQTGPNDEYDKARTASLPAWITAATSCPACGTFGLIRTADTVEADPDDEDDAHTHTEQAPDTSGEGAPPGKWDELKDNHPWAEVSQCPGCGQGHVTCTHPYHGDEPPAFKLPQSPSDMWDPQDAKFKENENTGESGFVPERIEVPPQGMEDLPTKKKDIKALEGQGLVYHQTVKEQGAPDDTQARRFVHKDRATAEVAHQRALDAGFDSELEPVMRRKVDRDSDFHTLNGRPTMGQVMNIGDDPYAPKGDVPTQLQGNCVRCGKETYMGDSADFGDVLKEGTVSCASCAPLVGANLDIYKSANREEILSYLYEEDPAEWAKVAQNIGCPNCEGQGSTPDGKVCAACFGTGSGGGVMLKGGSVDMPEEASFGMLFGDDGQMYKTVDGTNWEVMAATEHDDSEEEEDDDIKLFKFDHGPGEGNDMAHSEIHQQEHVSHGPDPKELAQHIESDQGTFKKLKKEVDSDLKDDVQEMIDDDKDLTAELRKSASEVPMSGSGCGRCGVATHRSERCPSNKGSNMTTEGEPQRYKDYSDFQPKEAALDDELMRDPYELDEESLMLDPFEAEKKKPVEQYAKEQGEAKQERAQRAEELGSEDPVGTTAAAKPKKKPKTKEEKAKEEKRKAKEKADKIEGGADKAADAVHWLTTPGGKHGQVNPGSGPAGTSVDDLTDDVGSGEHPVPVTFITDHKGEVTQGVESAICRQCGQEMSAHAQWNPTHQVGNPPKQASSLNWEEIGWMDDTMLPDTRPVRGSFDKDAHSPTYDVSLHDPQSPRVGTPCQFCGTGGAPTLGAVKAFSDPADPVSGRIVAHQSHYDDYKESVSTAAAAPAAVPVSTVVPSGEGKGVVINVYASRDDSDEAP